MRCVTVDQGIRTILITGAIMSRKSIVSNIFRSGSTPTYSSFLFFFVLLRFQLKLIWAKLGHHK